MHLTRLLPLAALFAAAGAAQTVCQPTPAFSPCEIVFELNDAEAAAHPDPYLTVELEAEFRSPRFRTYRMPAFWDGGRKMVIRFTPDDPGDWVFRLSGNLKRFEGQEGRVTATESGSPGFLRPANVHHWALVDDQKKTPHLWMGDTLYTFPFIDRGVFEKVIDARAAQKFNHVRGVILPRDAKALPDPAVFRELDDRIAYMNRKGIIADLVLAWDQNHLARLFPDREGRARYVRYVVARYAPFHITWQGVQEFEEYENGRAVLKEIGELLKKLDPYNHPRTTHTVATSSPLLADGWMDHVLYQSSDNHLGAIEHQLFGVPFVNSEFAYEDSGAGRTHPHHVETAEFRRRLWNATMNGQYPYFGNTGTYGAGAAGVDPKYLDSPGAKQMSAWFDFFSRTRFWELEPYFDVDGGRAVALQRPREDDAEGIEYIVYVEEPGPVEIVLPRHSYDIAWFNPINGEYTKLKDFKADRWMGEPPSKDHDWVLHISREGRKEGLRSYKFESRAIILQEVEQNPTRAPFEIAEPKDGAISLKNPPQYMTRLTRETRATRSMMYLWTGEVPGEEMSYRIIGTGAKGAFRLRPHAGRVYPASLAVRLFGMNANGKVYSLFRVWQLTE
jgi:hypothetical protein